MARIRTIKPEFWTHEDLSALPEATHMLAAALLNYCDDYGYFNANPKLIQAAVSPLREPSVSIPESLVRLSNVGYLELGTGTDGRQYGRITHFDQHQRVAHPTASKINNLEIVWNAHENLGRPPETFAPEQGTGNREQGSGTGKGEGAVAPTASGWKGVVVNLNATNYGEWLKAYSHLDLPAELTARDAWLAEQDEPTRRKWFPSTSKYLANRNMEARAKGESAARPPPIRKSRTMEAGERLLKEIRGGKFGPGICDEGSEDAVAQLPEPTARSRYLPAPSDNCLHGKAKGGASEDG